jgi:hypothetical protein
MKTSFLQKNAGRGQTLVLFALTLLLLTLMVCMTLSFSMRIREKIETQNLADAAAYTNAVATARTFNHVSMFNRTMVSHMVAQASAMSLVSWASIYRSGLNALNLWLLIMIAGTAADCSGWNFCACLALLPLILDWLRVLGESGRVMGLWDPLDIAAGLGQHTARSSVALLMYVAEMVQYMTNLQPAINNQSIANGQVVPGAQNSFNELSAPAGAASINNREIDFGGILGCLGSKGSSCSWNPVNLHAVDAGMGSRGWPFVTGRWDTAFYGNPLQTALNNAVGDGQVSIITAWGFAPFVIPVGLPWMGGSGMWSASMLFHGMLPFPSGINTYGEDHYWLNYQAGPACTDPSSGFFPLTAHVRASPFGLSEHQGFPGDFPVFFVPWSDAAPIIHDLTLLSVGPLAIPLPGSWPLFIDYNWGKVDDQSDNFGQPKNISLVQRDYAMRPQPADPWNLLFKYKFDPTGTGQTYNNQGIQLVSPTFAGTNVSQQMALATGITYYHRFGGGNWQEPPNFMNPFWRATLVPPDTDRQGTPAVAGYPAPWCGGGPCGAAGGEDPVKVMTGAGGASSALYVDAYRRLANVGFTGFQ